MKITPLPLRIFQEIESIQFFVRLKECLEHIWCYLGHHVVSGRNRTGHMQGKYHLKEDTLCY